MHQCVPAVPAVPAVQKWVQQRRALVGVGRAVKVAQRRTRAGRRGLWGDGFIVRRRVRLARSELCFFFLRAGRQQEVWEDWSIWGTWERERRKEGKT